MKVSKHLQIKLEAAGLRESSEPTAKLVFEYAAPDNISASVIISDGLYTYKG